MISYEKDLKDLTNFVNTFKNNPMFKKGKKMDVDTNVAPVTGNPLAGVEFPADLLAETEAPFDTEETSETFYVQAEEVNVDGNVLM